MNVFGLNDEFRTSDGEAIDIDHSKNEGFLGTFEVFHEFSQVSRHANSRGELGIED